MPRPKGLDTESRAPVFVLLTLIAAAAMCLLVALHLKMTPARAEGVMIITLCTTLEDERAIEGTPWDNHEIFAGDDAKRMLRVFNEEPPRSSLSADRIMLVSRTANGQPLHGIVLEHDNCIEGRFMVAEPLYQRLVNSARGSTL